MADVTSDAKALKNAIAQVVREVVREETKNCLRLEKAVLVSAPSENRCEVRYVGSSDGSVNIPCSDKIAQAYANGTLIIGQAIWVALPYSSDRNAIAWETGNFST